jgi:type I restriction enzyme S subunit
MCCVTMVSPTISIQAQIKDKIASATLGKLSLQNIKSLLIPLSTIPEQQEIVRILDDLFEKEQRARELCDVIEKIDLMKKAIFARAFRGELGTNDPIEESAMGLFRETLTN